MHLSPMVNRFVLAYAGCLAAIVFSAHGEDDVTSPPSLPTEITDKALLWVDARDTERLVCSGDNVKTWYDCREPVPVTAAKFCYCCASNTQKTATMPTLATMSDGQAAVYCGGIGSGVSLAWYLPSGKCYTGKIAGVESDRNCVSHVFLVHNSRVATNSVFVGTYSSTLTPFRRIDHLNNSGYFRLGDCWPTMANGRTYVNGERIDGMLTSVAGFQLLEMIPFVNTQFETSGFFNMQDSKKCGGEYLCEALVFTNELTEVQRLEVEDYLMEKWHLGKRKVMVDVAAKDSFEAAARLPDNTSVVGVGKIVNRGASDEPFVFKQSDAAAVFDGELDFGASHSALLLSPAALAVSAGQTVSVTNTEGGPVAEIGTAAKGELVKDGNETLRLKRFPAGVKALIVNDGMLAIDATAEQGLDDTYHEILVPDGGFEGFADEIARNTAEGDGVIAVTNNGAFAWQYRWNNSATVSVMDFERWDLSTKSVRMGADRSAWKIRTHPPEGRCALILRSGSTTNDKNDDAIVQTTGTLALKKGVHELRLKLCGRQNVIYRGQRLQMNFVDGSNKVKATFGEVQFTDVRDYVSLRFRTEVPEAGDYRVQFRSLDTHDGLILLDDVHLYEVTEGARAMGQWKVPGGDFETARFARGKAVSEFSANDESPDWTFSQVTGNPRTYVGVTTVAVTNESSSYGRGTLYNATRIPASGSFELCFSGSGDGAAAQTTFVPPKGTWHLQCDAAKFGSYGIGVKVEAFVTIGNGPEQSLGIVAPAAYLMVPTVWPKSFDADGATAVTVRLEPKNGGASSGANRAGVLADDFVLTPHQNATQLGVELSKCGDCESVGGSSDALKRIPATDFDEQACSGTVKSRKIPGESAAEVSAFGTNVVRGTYLITIENRAALYEDIDLPSAGTYRYSFWAHSRLANGRGSVNAPNPLRLWVERVGSGVTNVVGTVDTFNSAWVQRALEFSVDAPGLYRIALQGCDNPTNQNWRHEAHVDAISVRKILRGVSDDQPTFERDLKVRVAAGARLRLGFNGTNKVESVRLGGHAVHGVINAERFPDYLEGEGAFFAEERGGVFVVR